MSKLISTVKDMLSKLILYPESMFRRRHSLVSKSMEYQYIEGNCNDLNARKENWQQRVRLATAYRTLDSYGLNEGVCNHLTALAPSKDIEGNEVMLVIPYGLHWNEVTPYNLVGLNCDNQLVEGSGEVEISAVCIHRGVYQARPDVRSVMHTHMPYATALSCLKDPRLEMIHQNSCRFLNRLAYDPNYAGVVQASEEGKRIGTTLGQMDAMFMGNHGALTVGRTVAIAFDNMYYLERAAMVQVLALSTGKELSVLSPEVAEETELTSWKDIDLYAEAHLEAACRKLARKNKEFKSL